MSKVSIIIPCYNQGKYVAEAIESSINQTHENIEIIVVNDASTDNSSEIINFYAKKYENIKYIENSENKGVIFCRNLAIQKAHGEYILPLDADDKIAPQYIEKALAVFSLKAETKIVYCRSMLFGSKNKEFRLDEFSLDNIIFKNCIPNTSMFKKSDFLQVNGYKSCMKEGLEDWDFWLSIIETAKNKENCVYKLDEILFYYRKYKNPPSRSSFDKTVQLELQKNILNNHLELFSQNSEFLKRAFAVSPKKFAKYKSLYKKFMYGTIFCMFFILFLILGYVR